jgi:alkaline phosphatase D
MSLIIDRRRLIQAAGAGLLVTAALPGRALAQQTTGFTHGVASGDPAQTSVALWTRFVAGGETKLKLEVAEDEAFARIVSTAETTANPNADFTARTRATGLKPNRWYFYRFTSGAQRSVTGRTRTLPAKDEAKNFRIAVFSCSNGPVGWFNAYAHAAARDDIDLAIHTGDYIYEGAVGRPGAPRSGLSLQRDIRPDNEILTVADYRARYASYRNDPDLAELHRRLPMISVWDDHETANNSWKDGAEAHDPKTDGDWNARKAAGMRAYHEWLPMPDKWYGSYEIGDLATLFRLETRLLGRSKQLDTELNAIFAAGGSDLSRKIAAFGKGPLADAKRSMMGAEQEKWLAGAMKASVASGKRWQVMAQQVIMGTTLFPKSDSSWVSGGAPADVQADLTNRYKLTEAGVPYSMDKWDGYPAARERFYASARAAKANVVTLTGDSHNAWAYDLGDKNGAVGVEFAGQSVSSNGMERRFTGDALKVAAAYVAANPGLKWMDASNRGYFTVDISKDRVEGEFVFVPAQGGRSTKEVGRKKLVAEYGARKLVAWA